MCVLRGAGEVMTQWLRGLQGTQILFLASTWCRSAPPVIPLPGDPRSSSAVLGYLYAHSAYTLTGKHTCRQNSKHFKRKPGKASMIIQGWDWLAQLIERLPNIPKAPNSIPVLHKLGMMMHTCKASARGEGRRIKSASHSQLHRNT